LGFPIIGAFLSLLVSLLGAALVDPSANAPANRVVIVTPSALVTFVGHGAGHGVGMSQWGARGRALGGQTAVEILSAYYPGADISVMGDDSDAIRVLVGPSQVKTLPLADYLASVVSSELPPHFPTSAVEAQAIASRTYALWLRDPNKPYDVTSTVSTQAFGAAPRPDAVAAVDATQGMALTHDGAVIPAYFHACSVRATEDNENVWSGAPLPFLRSIDDRAPSGAPYATVANGCPRATWQAGPFTVAQLSNALAADPHTDVGTLQAIELGNRSPAGRWESITLDGDGGVKTVTLPVFRAVLSAGVPASRTLFSADFVIESTAPSSNAVGGLDQTPADPPAPFVL